MKSFAEVATTCPDSDIPLLRELLAYDSLCEQSCTFARDQLGRLLYHVAPSPLHWSRQIEWPWILRNGFSNGGSFQTNHNTLDIGSGWSVLKFALCKRSRFTTCLDNDQETLDKSQITIDQFRRRVHLGSWNIAQVKGDVRELPLLSNTYDRVVCVSVLEHLESGHEQALDEIIRVLKPGGMALITMDAVVSGDGCGKGNFYINLPKAIQLLFHLGITQLENQITIGAKLEDVDVGVVCLMACFVKE